MARINVTKAFLPRKEEYLKYIDSIWDSVYLTNNGPLLQRLEKELCDYLPARNLLVCGNGTIVLQMAIKALGITKEVITTPFSYVATLNAIVWENCKPVFADIDPKTLCIDAGKIEALITPETEAILCTHVYGYPCEVDKIAAIASQHGLKVIYDAAHAFGARLNGKSLLEYGDVSTCSFHATKLFHTIEGGAILANDDKLFSDIFKLRQFGHIYDDYYVAGINAKNSEMHAAMGLCVLPRMNEILQQRKRISELYDTLLPGIQRPEYEQKGFEYNYGYYPLIFIDETQCLKVKIALEKEEIFPRRYFYPSLNTLPFISYQTCPVSEDISRRVLCMPLYPDLDDADVKRISEIVNTCL